MTVNFKNVVNSFTPFRSEGLTIYWECSSHLCTLKEHKIDDFKNFRSEIEKQNLPRVNKKGTN